MSFQFTDLSQPILKVVTELGFQSPTEIQSKAIPFLLNSDHDFVGQAQTGTGKTAAFLIPLLERFDQSSDGIQGLILTPTRELAHQVYGELEKLCQNLPIEAMSIYGGVSYSQQIGDLKRKKIQIIVGTPGRVIDLINRRVLNISNCEQLIIDEADEMLNMGFLEDVEFIMNKLPKKRRLWMFSATMPRPITKMVEARFSQPKIIKIEKKTLSSENIAQYYCVLKRRDFSRALRVIVESQKECFGIIFCETREETKRLTEVLVHSGVHAVSLNGDLNQSQRDYAMERFKTKKVNFLVCTDVASRGIDVAHVTHVFNMGLPRQNESYVHRIGRTGRAGKSGEAITFVTPTEVRSLRRIEKLTGQKMKAYALPEPRELKRLKVLKELEKMDGVKEALISRGNEFVLDESYAYFKEYLEAFSKDQVLQMLFSYHFKKDMRQIDEALKVTTLEFESESMKSNKKRPNHRGKPRRPRRKENSRSSNYH